MNATLAQRASRLDWAAYGVLWVRMAFGSHALISGLNSFVPLFALGGGADPSPIAAFQNEMTRVGLYEFIKVIEVVVGTLLLSNRLVAFAAVIEMPITVAISYLCIFVDGRPGIAFSGAREIFFNAVLLVAYSKYFLPLLDWRAEYSPIWSLRSNRSDTP